MDNKGFCIQQLNENIFVGSPSTRHRNSTSKVMSYIACRYFIDYKRRIHIKKLTLIRRGQLDIDSTFKIDKTSISFPRFFQCCFNVEATQFLNSLYGVIVYRNTWLGNEELLISNLIANINLNYLKGAVHNLFITNIQGDVL